LMTPRASPARNPAPSYGDHPCAQTIHSLSRPRPRACSADTANAAGRGRGVRTSPNPRQPTTHQNPTEPHTHSRFPSPILPFALCLLPSSPPPLPLRQISKRTHRGARPPGQHPPSPAILSPSAARPSF
jgi:hypothetical protein